MEKFLVRLKENTHLIADIITIASFAVLVTIFLVEQNKIDTIERENKAALLKSLEIEIDANLEFIERFEAQKEAFKTTDEVTEESFSLLVIDEVISKGQIGNETDKVGMINLMRHMILVNNMLEPFQVVYLPNCEGQHDSWLKLKSETGAAISHNNVIIKTELESLKRKIVNMI
jgi:hypothetical protein